MCHKQRNDYFANASKLTAFNDAFRVYTRAFLKTKFSLSSPHFSLSLFNIHLPLSLVAALLCCSWSLQTTIVKDNFVIARSFIVHTYSVLGSEFDESLIFSWRAANNNRILSRHCSCKYKYMYMYRPFIDKHTCMYMYSIHV